MRDHENEIKNKGASVAAVGLGSVEYATAFREESGIQFPLLIDADQIAYKALGLHKANLLHLFRSDNFAGRKRAKANGHRQHRFDKDPFQFGGAFQLGGSFVFGPGNKDIFVHISETFGDNAPISNLLYALIPNDTTK